VTVAGGGERRSGCEGPLLGAEPGKLKQIRGRDVAVRFAFGAAISILAGLASIAVNPVFGGLFLAFPAILPASVTLIEQKESTGKAADDIEGATIGALGLAVFAVVTGTVLRHTTAVLALIAATAAWLVTSVALYLVIETLLRHRARRSQAGDGQPHGGDGGAAHQRAGGVAEGLGQRPFLQQPHGLEGERRERGVGAAEPRP
jgi:hypothetical protein